MTDWQLLPDSHEKYALYMCSRAWGLLKQAVHERSGGTCEKCQKNKMAQVHHLTYVRKYHERLEDLLGVCADCHEYFHPQPRQTARNFGEFLKGPIPLLWLSKAAALSGKSPLAIGLAVWFESGRKRSYSVKLTSKICERFSIDRKAKYRGLKELELAGLIKVQRTLRKNPTVEIIVDQEGPEYVI